VFAGEPLVLVSAGHRHTAGVTKDGALWSWGKRQYGQLGHGDGATRQCQERMSREMLGGSPAVVVACGGSAHAGADMGCVWSCGEKDSGRLGHGDEPDQLLLTPD